MPRQHRDPDAPKVVTRKILFYRIDAGFHPDTGNPRVVRFGHAITQLNALPFASGTNGRYLDGSGKQICLWADKNDSPFHLKLANIRRTQHPPVENAGTFSKLEIARGGGLAEITHMVIFPNRICGAEFNFYGPRASQLPVYAATKLAGTVPPFRLNSLMRPDLEQRLADINDVGLLDLKIRASYAQTLTRANHDLGAAFQAAISLANGSDEDEFELTFKRKTRKGDPVRSVPRAMLQALRSLARREGLREQVSVFK